MDMPISRIVALIDDDSCVREALKRLLSCEGYEVRLYGAAADYLQNTGEGARCIILDWHMPDLDGLQLQQILLERQQNVPLVFLSGRAGVPECAGAMKAGAIDFLIKPVDADLLLGAVWRAILLSEERTTHDSFRKVVFERLSTLTSREREVVDLVTQGLLNKQIAGQLHIVEKTVKVHRARAFGKLGVRSAVELARVLGATQIAQSAITLRSPVRNWAMCR
jgi:FixJ family two-component response regulator